MGFSKNPIAWVVVGAIILFAGYRMYTDVQAGDGPIVAIGIGIAAVIVVVLLVYMNRSAAGQLEAVTAMKRGSLVKQVLPTTAGMPINKAFVKSQGGKAKGLMTAQVASFDREAATLWTGGKNPKVALSVPAASIQSIEVRQLAEGMRTYNAIILTVSPETGAMIGIKDKDDALQPAVGEIADALGVDRSRVRFG